jgi:ornithine lipid ester-linked acyl 2-hydroxylase
LAKAAPFPDSPAQSPLDEQSSAIARASNENQPQPSAITRRLMAALAWISQQNLRCSIHGRGEIFVAADLPWVAPLEANWRIIRGELARLMMRKDAVSAFHESGGNPLELAQDRGWRTAPLLSYGFPHEPVIALCPETWRLLQQVPGLVGAMFSILEPGRFLPPHRGPYNGLLRLHLGLIVPEPAERVGLRVAGRILQWEEGRALLFDDTFEHEAWNDTDNTRAVLLLDFARPLRFPARLLNWLVLHTFAFRPFIREGLDRARWWERRFYREAQAVRLSDRIGTSDGVEAGAVGKDDAAAAPAPGTEVDATSLWRSGPANR